MFLERSRAVLGAGSILLAAMALALALSQAAWGQSPGGANANTGNPFVAAVSVDVTAETAAAAREKALAEGQRKALRRVLERLTLRLDHDLLPTPEMSRLLDLVQDFTVEEERRSAVRYIAEMTVRFKPDEVREYLRSMGVPYAETLSRPVVVLPVFQAAPDAREVLWEDPNPWRAVWSARRSDDGLVPKVIPLGDLEDILTIDAAQALSGEPDMIAAMAERYDAGDVLVVHAAVAPGATTALDVAVSRLGPSRQDRPSSRSFTAREDEDLEGLLTRAAAEVSAIVEENWKRDNLIQYGRSARITVLVPLSSLEEWVAVRQRLERVAFIDRSTLQGLTRDRAQMVLHFTGNEQQLSLALSQNDLELEWSGGYWTLAAADRETRFRQDGNERR